MLIASKSSISKICENRRELTKTKGGRSMEGKSLGSELSVAVERNKSLLLRVKENAVESEVRMVPMVNSSKFAIVDAEDYDRVMQHKWVFDGKGIKSKSFKDGSTIYLRRLVLNLPVLSIKERKYVYVKNGNSLDCRKGNLVVKDVGGKSSFIPEIRYKGVHKTSSGRWVAKINVKGRYHGSESFLTSDDAAKEYDRMSIKYRGKRLALKKGINFPSSINEIPQKVKKSVSTKEMKKVGEKVARVATKILTERRHEVAPKLSNEAICFCFEEGSIEARDARIIQQVKDGMRVRIVEDKDLWLVIVKDGK